MYLVVQSVFITNHIQGLDKETRCLYLVFLKKMKSSSCLLVAGEDFILLQFLTRTLYLMPLNFYVVLDLPVYLLPVKLWTRQATLPSSIRHPLNQRNRKKVRDHLIIDLLMYYSLSLSLSISISLSHSLYL